VSSEAVTAAIRKLAFGQSLTADDTHHAFDAIMAGEASAAMVGALLMALRVKGETPGEVAGAARAMRHAMVRIPAEQPEELVDTCGTGGGTVTTFNISTAAALVAAGAGVRIAKHGNRSFTTKCGSADVLEALGIPMDAEVGVMERSLRDAGIVFMFAPRMHPAMKHVIPVRRDLAVPTVMNILGPLANPAGAGRQVVGVGDAGRMRLIADALAELGAVHAMVVHGEPGLDEVSPLGPTRVLEIRQGAVSEWTIVPEDHGVHGVAAEDLAGGDPADNARLVEEILHGRANPGARAAVVLNAAAAIYVAGRAPTFAAGVATARQSMEQGWGVTALDALRRAYASRVAGA
jgi:anthranilate phosphoribosyltransferase